MKILNEPRILRAEASDMEEILKLQCAAYQSEALLHNDFTIQPLRQTLDEIKAEYHESVFLKAVENGDLSIRAPETYLDEVGDIARGFNKMLTEIQNHINRVSATRQG